MNLNSAVECPSSVVPGWRQFLALVSSHANEVTNAIVSIGASIEGWLTSRRNAVVLHCRSG